MAEIEAAGDLGAWADWATSDRPDYLNS
jgi:hypothetical protein